jgi:hypothetical protein
LPTLTISAQAPAFRSGVELVEVTAIVRDSEGRVVRDLMQSDFRLLERGRPQRISMLERVSIPLVLWRFVSGPSNSSSGTLVRRI